MRTTLWAGGPVLVFWVVTAIAAGDATAAYPAMAPLTQYQIAGVAEEVALARSAAPASISADAQILALGEHGYETAIKGKNGFVCLVERSWANDFDDDQFWNPKVRAPMCLNLSAAHTVLPGYLERTEWVLAGKSKSDMLSRTKAEIASKRYVMPGAGAMCYMMSQQGYLSDADGHWHPHLMFFLGNTAGAAWGANLAGSPIFAAKGNPEPVTTFFVPVQKWSDGTPAVMETH
jgi:hypothetical protein